MFPFISQRKQVVLSEPLFKQVVEHVFHSKMKYDIPCCRDVYYAAYRRFFWLLSKRRD